MKMTTMRRRVKRKAKRQERKARPRMTVKEMSHQQVLNLLPTPKSRS
jgi:hypothetical protein